MHIVHWVFFSIFFFWLTIKARSTSGELSQKQSLVTCVLWFPLFAATTLLILRCKLLIQAAMLANTCKCVCWCMCFKFPGKERLTKTSLITYSYSLKHGGDFCDFSRWDILTLPSECVPGTIMKIDIAVFILHITIKVHSGIYQWETWNEESWWYLYQKSQEF